ANAILRLSDSRFYAITGGSGGTPIAHPIRSAADLAALEVLSRPTDLAVARARHARAAAGPVSGRVRSDLETLPPRDYLFVVAGGRVLIANSSGEVLAERSTRNTGNQLLFALARRLGYPPEGSFDAALR